MLQQKMNASTEIPLSPTSISHSDQVIDKFNWEKILKRSDDDDREESPPPDEEFEDYDEEDFSFSCIPTGDESPISADDLFQNGRIKPIFPVFDQTLLWDLKVDLPRRPPVKKVFVEENNATPTPATAPDKGEAGDMFCAWSGKAVEASEEICKKSSSTGFSKLFRFRDLLNRSNSDGRDAFVFLNDSATTSSKGEEKVEKSERTLEKKITGEAEATVAGKKVKAKGGKGETASLSAHYIRNRALREGDRRRTYLPYKPELVGFFTDVHGGLSRNVHPF